MSEKMLVTQALDERDLLVKKIRDKINKANFTDIKKRNEEKVYIGRIRDVEFKKEVESTYQQILDLISRFQKIDAAILFSNATTNIQTSFGDFSVAGAISLRSRMKGVGIYEEEGDFEFQLLRKMKSVRDEHLIMVEEKNSSLEETAEQMRLSILGKENRIKEDKPLAVVDTYVKENTTELVDPIQISKKIEILEEKRMKLLSELETQIKVSNATTFIEI